MAADQAAQLAVEVYLQLVGALEFSLFALAINVPMKKIQHWRLHEQSER